MKLRWRIGSLLVFAVGLGVTGGACGGSSDVEGPGPDGGSGSSGTDGAGGSNTGGSSTGGSSTGGSSTGGSTGGSNTGGSSTGGSSTGGSSTGGSSTGGSSTGGSSTGGSSTGGSSTGGSGGSSTGGSGGTGGCGTTQCTNCIDDDGDGKIDAADPECTGAADNDESSFGTGIPGDNVDPKWQDCFFDGDSGHGNDGCRYHTDCLTGAKQPDDPDCIVSQDCLRFCMPHTPNGCDCFGCCDLTLSGGTTISVTLSPECSSATANDPTKCVPCTKSTICNNDCKRCELCVGKTVLPPDCNTGGTGGAGGTGGSTGGSGGSGGSCPKPLCPANIQSCGVSCLPSCPTGNFCLTGCCTPPPP